MKIAFLLSFYRKIIKAFIDASLRISFLKSDVIILLLGLLIIPNVAFASSKLSNELVLLSFPIIVIVLYFIVFKHPEISFALFLNAGVYKVDPRLSFLTDILDLTVLFCLLTITGIIFRIVTKKIKFIMPPKEIFIPFVIIAVMGIFSLTYTLAPIYGADKLLRFLILTSMAMFLPFYLFQDTSSIGRFFTLYTLVALLMIFDVMIGGITPGQWEWHSAFGSNYLAMAFTTGYASIVVLFYFMLNSEYKLKSFLYLCLLMLLMLGSFISGGRGPVIALFISIIAISCYLLLLFGRDLLFFKIKKSFLKLLFLVIFPIFISIGILAFNSEYFTTFLTRIEAFQSSEGFLETGRQVRYHDAIDIMLSFPEGITGVGTGGFSVYHAEFDDKRGDYPHNIFLEIGSELGIIGFLAIIFMVCRSFQVSFHSLKTAISNRSYIGMTLFALLVYTIMNASISGDINDNRSLFTVIGLIFAYRNVQVFRNKLN